MNTFEKLTAPLKKILDQQASQIDAKAKSKALFFSDFTLKMVYAVVMRISSLRMLVSELETNPTAPQLGFTTTPYSTLQDAFSRFCSSQFKEIYINILKSYQWLSIKAIDEVGIIKLVDGSLFPTLKSMFWAEYKKTKNSIRLHLEFELNTMIPTEFIAQKANSGEREFLLSILKKGGTYIADRGYFSFSLADAVEKAKAFFIIRIKSNLKFTVLESLKITTLEKKIPTCFQQITDQIISFNNDSFGHHYRLICFCVLESKFMICTNRLGLSTLQIIMLYAYRWQIELLFKFLKRTLNGIHLFNNSENGVNIQFYIFMITALLQLKLKQFCRLEQEKINQEGKKLEEVNQEGKKLEDLNTYSGDSPELWIKSIATVFYKYWKIGCHWLLHLRNLIAKPFDGYVILKLAST